MMADCVLWGQFPTTFPYSIYFIQSTEVGKLLLGRRGEYHSAKEKKMTNSGNCYVCQEVWLDVPETDGRYQISNHGHLRQMRRKELLSKIMKMAADIKLQASGSWMPPIKSLQKKSECVPRRMLCRPLLKNPLLQGFLQSGRASVTPGDF